MALRAVISDIHGNLEALRAVLADIETQHVDEIVCLGDIVGYGPNPVECVNIVRKTCRWSLCGNHDAALFMTHALGFNESAAKAVDLRPGRRPQREHQRGMIQMRMCQQNRPQRYIAHSCKHRRQMVGQGRAGVDHHRAPGPVQHVRVGASSGHRAGVCRPDPPHAVRYLHPGLPILPHPR